MGAVAVDSSVLVALMDPADEHHAAAAQALRRARRSGDVLTLSAVVLAECLVDPFRQGGDQARRRADGFLRLFGPVRPVDDGVALEAARLRALHRWLRLPDALVLATANVDATDVLLTCDRRWAKVSGSVRVVGVRATREGATDRPPR